MGTKDDASKVDLKAEDIVKGIDKERESILFERNKQYSANNNFTANFNDTAAIVGILGIKLSGRDVAIVLAVLKLVRDNNAKEAGISLSDRRDHLIDLHNYIDLAHLCEVNDEQFKALKELLDRISGPNEDVNKYNVGQ